MILIQSPDGQEYALVETTAGYPGWPVLNPNIAPPGPDHVLSGNVFVFSQALQDARLAALAAATPTDVGMTMESLQAQITALEEGAGAPSWSDVTNKPTAFPPSAHDQAISTITGLTDALAGKQATLESGTNIKTVGGVSVLGSGNIPVGGAAALAQHDFWQETWFSTTNVASPDRWNGTAVSAGTNTTAIPAAALAHKFRHGVFLRSGTTANGGYRYQTTSVVGDTFGQASHKFKCAFMWRGAFTGRTVRIGFHDTVTNADAVDGAYFEVLDAVCSAKTASNSARTANATTLTLSLDIPYVFDIEVNAAGNSARFRVFNGDTGASLLDVSNTANIPANTARAFGSGIVATEASTTASDIGILYLLGEGTVEGYTRARG
jgi:hypothetical protein